MGRGTAEKVLMAMVHAVRDFLVGDQLWRTANNSAPDHGRTLYGLPGCVLTDHDFTADGSA